MRLDEGDYRVDKIVHGFGWSFQSIADVVPVMCRGIMWPGRPGNGRALFEGGFLRCTKLWIRGLGFKPSCTAA
jgi:hypothetical protein